MNKNKTKTSQNRSKDSDDQNLDRLDWFEIETNVRK